MPDSAFIQLGTVGIGRVWADPTKLRGEGGSADPRLVVPIEIQMLERAGQQLAVVRLTASLHLDASAFPSNRIGGLSTHDLLNGMPCASRPNSPTHVEELRFALTSALVQRLEDARQSTPSGKLVFFLKLQPLIVGLRKTEGQSGALGLYSSDLAWFWTANIDPLRVEVEPSVWIAQVLPGMGHDRVRYLEVHLPPTSAPASDATRFFDAARAELDFLRYRASIGECRSVRHAYEKSLGATQERPFAELLADRVGWHADDARRKTLGSVWEGFVTLTNSAHHPSAGKEPTAADARFCLFLTALLVDYVERLWHMSVK